MGFFFDGAVIENLKPPPRAQPAPKKKRAEGDVLPQERGCDLCPLQEIWPRISTPRMPLSGATNGDILILGEAPGEDEDIKGEAFVGASGKFIRRHIPYRMLDRVAFSNAARCRPPGNRTPTGLEMHCCSIHLEDEIARGNFKAILGLGGAPMVRYLSEATITQASGIRFPVELGGKALWYYPAFHPSFLRHNGGDRAREYPVFAADVKRFFQDVDKWAAPTIERIKPTDVISVFDRDQAWDLYHRLKPDIAIDLETYKLKPYEIDAKLLTGALSDGELSFAFPVDHMEFKTDWGLELLLTAAADRQWSAHNVSFELVWLLWLARELGLDRWQPHAFDDSMAFGRLYHARETLLDLGTMTRIVLGVNVKTLTNVNARRIAAYPLEEILPYNGLDSWGSAKIVKRLKGKVLKGEYARLIGAIESTTHMELLGLSPSQDAAEELETEWGQKATEHRAKAATIYEVKAFERERQQEFNLGNAEHVGSALVDYGKLILPKNKKGYSTEEEHLLPLVDKNPLVKVVLDYREAVKHVSTYIEPIKKIPARYKDSRAHPSYTTMHVATFRTSSNDFNIQNWPKRRHREFRRQIVPRPGHIFMPCDAGQIQARIYGMASKDRALCKSFIDKEDIHTYWLQKLLGLYPEYIDRLRAKLNNPADSKIMKEGRNQIKTDLVFASFFGTTAANCAERTGIPFDVIQELLLAFWARYAGAFKWLKARRNEYRETGGVRTLNGQFRHGVMTGNEPIITPIQNGEAVLILDAQNELMRMSLEYDDPYFMPRINVHDDLTLEVPDQDDKIEMYAKEVSKVMTKIRYKWQIVPLTVEVQIGYNWADTEEIMVYEGDYIR